MPILAHVVWWMAHCHPRVFDLLQRHFLLCRCFGGSKLLGVRQKDGNNSIGKLGKPIQKPKPQGNTQGISRISSISCLSMSRILICTLPSGVKPGVLENQPWLLRVEFFDSCPWPLHSYHICEAYVSEYVREYPRNLCP